MALRLSIYRLSVYSAEDDSVCHELVELEFIIIVPTLIYLYPIERVSVVFIV